MAKYLRYVGEFLSRAGVVWRVEILQESAQAFDTIGALTFEADEALTIEYPSTAKEEVICGSTATIQIESPGDRTYEDLYTIEVGAIRMDVYREGALYWSGTLDPEFYEEPYEKAAHYVVSLTFSDFGVLDRLNYTLAGMLTLREIVVHCLAQTCINYNVIDESLISTGLSTSQPMSLSSLKVRSDNFYDEDGEPNSLKEVLEGILQPLGLRMIQRAGKVFIYDLNGLYTKGKQAQAIWSGDSSTMGVDVVYNNAKITWSTYAQSGNLSPESCWTEEIDTNLTNINNITPRAYKNSEYLSYHYSTTLADWIDATDSGFTLWTNKKGSNAELNDTVFTGVRFFRMVPQYDGSECEGIALFWRGFQGFKVGSSHNWYAQLSKSGFGINPAYLAGTLSDSDKYIFKSTPVWIPPVDNSNELLMRICLPMLVDPRFNPSEQAANIMSKFEDENDWQKKWKARGNFLYIPVTIKFQPDGSEDIYCWDNRYIVRSDVKSPIKTIEQTYGTWQKYDTKKDDKPETWGYLCYYDPNDRKENSGVAQGWKTNRPAINPHTEQITTALEKSDEGQFIPYPHYGTGGKIWVEVRGKGWMISDGGVNLSADKIIDSYKIWTEGPKISWILAQLPTIEIVNNIQFEQTINTDDVEYSAEINAKAKEPIELDTICGSSAEGIPTARGAYFNADTGAQIRQLTRAGRTSQIEELLIGTLYSQYAERRTMLSGEIELHPGGLVSYTEQNQEGKVFIMTAETQDVITDTTEATLIELRPDEYDKK